MYETVLPDLRSACKISSDGKLVVTLTFCSSKLTLTFSTLSAKETSKTISHLVGNRNQTNCRLPDKAWEQLKHSTFIYASTHTTTKPQLIRNNLYVLTT